MKLSGLLLTIGTTLTLVWASLSGGPAVRTENRSGALGNDEGRRKNLMEEYSTKPLSMKATAKNTNAGLLIEYIVENNTDKEHYLWDLMIKYEGNTQKIDHDGAYVFFVAPKTLNVIRAELPLPTAFDVARKEIPFARLLPAGGTLTGKVKLPHPVTEFSPYYPPPNEENQEKSVVSEVVLMIGWTSVKPGMNISERDVGGEKVYAIRGAWAAPYQELLQEKLAVSVEVTTYKGDFERQTPLR